MQLALGRRNKSLLRALAAVVAALAVVVSSGILFLCYQNSHLLLETSKESQKSKENQTQVSNGDIGHSANHAKESIASADTGTTEHTLGLDEFFINVTSIREREKVYSIGLKLDLSLYEDADEKWVKQNLPGIRNAVIETTREQDYYHLKTTAGKLYFKELLVQRINHFLGTNAVQDIRFAALLFHG